MKNYFLVLLFSATLLQASDSQQVLTSEELQGVEKNTTAELDLHYADFDWDVGLVGGLTYDGVQIDAKRTTIGLGLNLGYHITPGFTVQGEYVDYFKSFADHTEDKDIRTKMAALSLAYDFTPEDNFSLFVKAGIGYEALDIYQTNQHHPISLIGLGFRFKLANRVSTYLQGRWRMRLSDISQPDNGLVATWGLDYHFGLSDEKNDLAKMVETHNASLEP